MHCSTCGALIDVAPFSEVATCEHCGTTRELRLLEAGLDRVIWTEEDTGTPCPRCGEGLVRAQLDGYTVGGCPECHGVLLANSSFGAIVRRRRQNYRAAPFTPRPVDLDELTDPVYCPGCERTMGVHPYYGPGCQIIDSCGRCELVWIDSGELTAIERAPGLR
ncbi:MAG: zf-TFIIB domain-containing protein [Planctomycetaceae bacterium]